MPAKRGVGSTGVTSLTVTEAVRGFSEIVNRVVYRGESFLLLRGGKPVVRLLPATDDPVPTAGGLSRRWAALPRLDPADAADFARDLDEGRGDLLSGEGPSWD